MVVDSFENLMKSMVHLPFHTHISPNFKYIHKILKTMSKVYEPKIRGYYLKYDHICSSKCRQPISYDVKF